ncbi:MAG: acyl-ACP--UDP-N-acetylglucosamine O-acyltransferase [Lysobacterales bacterium]
MIHPQAVVDGSAEIADDVTIGPFCVIGPKVKIDSGCVIGPHAVVNGPTSLGKNNRIFQFASVGEDPQDKKFRPEHETRLEIGDDNTFRESCTINRGTEGGGGVTKIGHRNWIMAYVHIAHDCIIGNDVTFANCASLAGHVEVEDNAIIGGFSLIHQFCRIGRNSFTGMGASVNRDVPPYVVVAGKMSEPRGINSEGLRRHGFSADRIAMVKRAYKTLYTQGHPLSEAVEHLTALAQESDDIAPMVEFIKNSQRSIIR